ncbi:MAG: hypothetical protein OXF52_00975 [Candidatus Dadabacteria bacterium]|nr:hypothetical protein [Candidatus Dadabacteria bacterium]
MSTEARYLENATYRSASDEDDAIFFVDTTLRVTPQLALSEAVTIRAQVDIMNNNIWGGYTDQLLGGASTLVNSSISPSDQFRGTILHGNGTSGCLAFGTFCAVEEDAGFFNVRMVHADVVLPNNLGFIRVGRQPFDWGLGILANGGWNPASDGGFLVDRFLWLKTFPTGGDATVTAIFVSDRITQGTGLHTGGGDGWDGGALAVVFNHANMGGVNVTVGGYIFPYIHQDNFLGGGGSLDRYTLYSGLVDLKAEGWKFTGEVQGGFGEITNISFPTLGLAADTVKANNALIWAVRAEYLAPTLEYLNVVGAEFGWADGDQNDGTAWGNGGDIEGGVIVFNPAYNLDNLLFKHVMPSIYQDANGNILAKADASVQNAYYARVYADIPVTERVSFRPQVVVGWNNETEGLIRESSVGTVTNGTTVTGSNVGANDSAGMGTGRATVTAPLKPEVSAYLGTEIEGDIKVNLYPGVDLNIIGSVIVAGEGLTDLLEAQAFARNDSLASTAHTNGTTAETAIASLRDSVSAEDIIWGVKTSLNIYIDEFFKSDDI